MMVFKVFPNTSPTDVEENMNKLSEYGYNIVGVHQYKENGKVLFLIVGSTTETPTSHGDNQPNKVKN